MFPGCAVCYYPANATLCHASWRLATEERQVERELRQIVAQRLRVLRASSGLSQDGLAQRIGTVRQSVSGWESGLRVPSTAMVVQLARHYGVSADVVLGMADIRIGAAG